MCCEADEAKPKLLEINVENESFPKILGGTFGFPFHHNVSWTTSGGEVINFSNKAMMLFRWSWAAGSSSHIRSHPAAAVRWLSEFWAGNHVTSARARVCVCVQGWAINTLVTVTEKLFHVFFRVKCRNNLPLRQEIFQWRTELIYFWKGFNHRPCFVLLLPVSEEILTLQLFQRSSC